MKRLNIMLLLALAVEILFFAGYQLWVHNSLDVKGPVINIEEGLLEISVSDPEEALLQGVSAQDARDGDVTPSLLVESVYGINDQKIATVTYAAFDRAGNVTKAERQVCYKDYRSPRFTAYDSLCFASGSGFDLLDAVGAEDVIEGDIRRRVRATLVSNTRSINEIGSHTVRLQVTNSLGDTVEADIPVKVYDPEWYTAEVELEEYLVYLKKGQSFDPDGYLKTFVVRGEAINVRYGIPEDISCDIKSNVNTQVPGIYEVTYTLSKNLNLATFSGQAVLVVIVQE